MKDDSSTAPAGGCRILLPPSPPSPRLWTLPSPRPGRTAPATLARALHAVHQRGVVHRDLKPGNVLLTPDGTPKISDFGLAKRLEEAAGLTASGVALGTPGYMAPEQAAGRAAEVGPAADLH